MLHETPASPCAGMTELVNPPIIWLYNLNHMIDLSFSFSAPCWRWQSTATAWHFITLPEDKSEEIKFFSENVHGKRRGWGAVRVQATIGETTWQTSIFPQFKTKIYILPVKADVRKKEKILADNMVEVRLKIEV